MLDETRKAHWIATGPPHSRARIAQYDSASEIASKLRDQGILEFSAQRPPRWYEHNDQQWRQWWMDQGEGRDLTSSAYAHNGHVTRDMSSEQKLEYGKRFQGGKGMERSHLKLSWNCVKTIEEVIGSLVDHGDYSKSRQREDLRFTSCVTCGIARLGSKGLKHTCVEPDLPDDQVQNALKGKKPSSGRSAGLVSITLKFAHQLLDHPTAGFASIDTQQSLSQWLAPLDIEVIDSWSILRQPPPSKRYAYIFDYTLPTAPIQPI